MKHTKLHFVFMVIIKCVRLIHSVIVSPHKTRLDQTMAMFGVIWIGLIFQL